MALNAIMVMFIRISRIHPSVSEFLLGKCKKGSKCSGHHCTLPFHWQFKDPEMDEWESFSEIDNEKLEKLYCDVMLEELCSAIGFDISFEFEGCDLNFLLDNKLMIVQTNFEDFQDLEDVEDFEVIAPIRRLSTESYITNPGNHVATAWTWYWKEQDGIWLQYDVDQLGRDLQRSIEEAFLNKTNCFKFTISNQDYALDFSKPTDMHQENLTYGTTRKVRRRPAEVKSGADILELKRSREVSSAEEKQDKMKQNDKVPSHWSWMPSDEQYKRIPITAMSSEYNEVETLFKKTINKSVTINSIERVQKPVHVGEVPKVF
ncbi:poly ADP-ribose polymerase [Desmophyllum pertusum]|uniref:Poly ADP-ribose polymerase n=1 Tax=Desmophyllum pertusum TaxID=174260 RepID=A0A9X0CFG4_9CNID|nr:poly ADP-ribose polymerase [Desmophyllum pertusum]